MKVWLIWQVSASDGWVRYVCGTEEKARKKFEDVKQDIIKEDEEIYNAQYEDEEYEEMQRAHLEKRKKILNAMTFDDLTPGRQTVNSKPYWEVWEVE